MVLTAFIFMQPASVASLMFHTVLILNGYSGDCNETHGSDNGCIIIPPILLMSLTEGDTLLEPRLV